MRTVISALLPALAPLAMFALAGCEKQPLYVDQAVIRLSPNAATPSAGYFTIHAGDAPVTLRAVTTDSAVRVEMHDNVTRNGMVSMKQIDSVDVPAKGVVRFEPGGRHLMLWNINAAAADSGKVTLTLLFSNGDRILVDAAVQKAGTAPAANAMGGNSAAMNGNDMADMHH